MSVLERIEPSSDGAAHHETPRERHRKEHLAIWVLIAGDGIFAALEIFTWFYLRALNTNGMWRGAACTSAKPCTDGLGNPITHEIARAAPGYTIAATLCVILAALLVRTSELAVIHRRNRSAVATPAGIATIALIAAVVIICVQYSTLPFQTIDGSYASCFEFFMGATMAHAAILGFVTLGMWNRARRDGYRDGQWYRPRVIRIFATWIAASTLVLALVMLLGA